jgi:ADP-heptose:LPS heptosyltransferase
MTLLVHLGAGVGDIVLATPLLIALRAQGHTIDLALDADYPETATLFEGWSVVRAIAPFDPRRYDAVLPAIPPFYEQRFSRAYSRLRRKVPRPRASLFYENEQGWYLEFARALGCECHPSLPPYLPIAPDESYGVTARTVVLAPGCKTGEMALKRWPHFPALAGQFDDVAIVGTADDLHESDGTRMKFPPHARNLAGRLTLRETASVLASAGVVVANDSGLGHLSAAAGAPTILLFGPTPHLNLRPFPPWVQVLRAGLPCEPCWFNRRFEACARRVDCLREVPLQAVAEAVNRAVTQPAA